MMRRRCVHCTSGLAGIVVILNFVGDSNSIGTYDDDVKREECEVGGNLCQNGGSCWKLKPSEISAMSNTNEMLYRLQMAALRSKDSEQQMVLGFRCTCPSGFHGEFCQNGDRFVYMTRNWLIAGLTVLISIVLFVAFMWFCSLKAAGSKADLARVGVGTSETQILRSETPSDVQCYSSVNNPTTVSGRSSSREGGGGGGGWVSGNATYTVADEAGAHSDKTWETFTIPRRSNTEQDNRQSPPVATGNRLSVSHGEIPHRWRQDDRDRQQAASSRRSPDSERSRGTSGAEDSSGADGRSHSHADQIRYSPDFDDRSSAGRPADSTRSGSHPTSDHSTPSPGLRNSGDDPVPVNPYPVSDPVLHENRIHQGGVTVYGGPESRKPITVKHENIEKKTTKHVSLSPELQTDGNPDQKHVNVSAHSSPSPGRSPPFNLHRKRHFWQREDSNSPESPSENRIRSSRRKKPKLFNSSGINSDRQTETPHRTKTKTKTGGYRVQNEEELNANQREPLHDFRRRQRNANENSKSVENQSPEDEDLSMINRNIQLRSSTKTPKSVKTNAKRRNNNYSRFRFKKSLPVSRRQKHRRKEGNLPEPAKGTSASSHPAHSRPGMMPSSSSSSSSNQRPLSCYEDKYRPCEATEHAANADKIDQPTTARDNINRTGHCAIEVSHITSSEEPAELKSCNGTLHLNKNTEDGAKNSSGSSSSSSRNSPLSLAEAPQDPGAENDNERTKAEDAPGDERIEFSPADEVLARSPGIGEVLRNSGEIPATEVGSQHRSSSPHHETLVQPRFQQHEDLSSTDVHMFKGDLMQVKENEQRWSEKTQSPCGSTPPSSAFKIQKNSKQTALSIKQQQQPPMQRPQKQQQQEQIQQMQQLQQPIQRPQKQVTLSVASVDSKWNSTAAVGSLKANVEMAQRLRYPRSGPNPTRTSRPSSFPVESRAAKVNPEQQTKPSISKGQQVRSEGGRHTALVSAAANDASASPRSDVTDASLLRHEETQTTSSKTTRAPVAKPANWKHPAPSSAAGNARIAVDTWKLPVDTHARERDMVRCAVPKTEEGEERKGLRVLDRIRGGSPRNKPQKSADDVTTGSGENRASELPREMTSPPNSRFQQKTSECRAAASLDRSEADRNRDEMLPLIIGPELPELPEVIGRRRRMALWARSVSSLSIHPEVSLGRRSHSDAAIALKDSLVNAKKVFGSSSIDPHSRRSHDNDNDNISVWDTIAETTTESGPEAPVPRTTSGAGRDDRSSGRTGSRFRSDCDGIARQNPLQKIAEILSIFEKPNSSNEESNAKRSTESTNNIPASSSSSSPAKTKSHIQTLKKPRLWKPAKNSFTSDADLSASLMEELKDYLSRHRLRLTTSSERALDEPVKT